MLIVTSETVANHRIVKTLGLVRGNTVRARHVGKDILAGLRYILSADGFTGQMLALDGGQHLVWRTADVLGVE